MLLESSYKSVEKHGKSVLHLENRTAGLCLLPSLTGNAAASEPSCEGIYERRTIRKSRGCMPSNAGDDPGNLQGGNIHAAFASGAVNVPLFGHLQFEEAR